MALAVAEAWALIELGTSQREGEDDSLGEWGCDRG